MVYFNVHRVIRKVLMVKQQQQIKQKTANYELLEEILEGIKVGVEDQKYNFQQYILAAQNEGLSQPEIWTLAKETLSSHVSLRTLYRWAHEYLTEEAFDIKQSERRKNKTLAVDKWQPELKQQIEDKHYEDESVAEAYDISKVKEGLYSYQYLQQVAIWLHETLEINCRGK